MNSTPRRRVEKRGTRRAGLAYSRTCCSYMRESIHTHARTHIYTHIHTHCYTARDDRGCWENDNAALERRFVNTLEKMRGVLGEGARKGGLRNGRVIRSRRKTPGNPPPRLSGIYLPPISLGSRPWKVNELRSLSLSSPSLLLAAPELRGF